VPRAQLGKALEEPGRGAIRFMFPATGSTMAQGDGIAQLVKSSAQSRGIVVVQNERCAAVSGVTPAELGLPA